MVEATIVQRLETRPDRVRDHSAHGVNRRIMQVMQARVEQCIHLGRDAVVARLQELEREWDIDRVLMTNFAVAGGLTCLIGVERYADTPFLGERRTGWLYVFGAQLAFLLMHASIGWCPPMAVWRRIGVRTKGEIDVERAMLSAALEPPAIVTNGGPPLSAPQVSS